MPKRAADGPDAARRCNVPRLVVLALLAAAVRAAADAGVIDAGVFVVDSARMARTESFELRREADGSWLLASVTTGAGNRYRVEGQWRFDADWRATGASGRGQAGDASFEVSIRKAGAEARISAGAAEAVSEYSASCAADCLMDLAPSALPMFTMTRRYDAVAGGIQSFRWVGHSLTDSQVLLDGLAQIERAAVGSFRTAAGTTVEVQQFAFVETLRDEASGQSFKVRFNLYVDAAHRPLAFAIGANTRGERVGYEGLIEALPFRAPSGS
jgi:hypothetical protein